MCGIAFISISAAVSRQRLDLRYRKSFHQIIDIALCRGVDNKPGGLPLHAPFRLYNTRLAYYSRSHISRHRQSTVGYFMAVTMTTLTRKQLSKQPLRISVTSPISFRIGCFLFIVKCLVNAFSDYFTPRASLYVLHYRSALEIIYIFRISRDMPISLFSISICIDIATFISLDISFSSGDIAWFLSAHILRVGIYLRVRLMVSGSGRTHVAHIFLPLYYHHLSYQCFRQFLLYVINANTKHFAKLYSLGR